MIDISLICINYQLKGGGTNVFALRGNLKNRLFLDKREIILEVYIGKYLNPLLKEEKAIGEKFLIRYCFIGA